MKLKSSVSSRFSNKYFFLDKRTLVAILNDCKVLWSNWEILFYHELCSITYFYMKKQGAILFKEKSLKNEVFIEKILTRFFWQPTVLKFNISVKWSLPKTDLEKIFWTLKVLKMSIFLNRNYLNVVTKTRNQK